MICVEAMGKIARQSLKHIWNPRMSGKWFLQLCTVSECGLIQQTGAFRREFQVSYSEPGLSKARQLMDLHNSSACCVSCDVWNADHGSPIIWQAHHNLQTI